MILICPACSTRFAVDASAFGPEGRRVRCGSCRHVWHQPPPQVDQTEEEDSPPPLTAAAPPAMPRPGTEREPALYSTGRGTARPAQPPRRPARRGAAVAWAALAAVVLLVVGGAWFARDAIVAAWPQASALYDLIGFAGDPPGTGLELRSVTSKREMQGETTVLLIEGEVANVSEVVRQVPRIRGALVDEGGQEIRNWLFTLPEPKLLPGEAARFKTELRDPPNGARRLTMTFTHES